MFIVLALLVVLVLVGAAATIAAVARDGHAPRAYRADYDTRRPTP